MYYCVLCSFDLKTGGLEEQQDALAELTALGFTRWVTITDKGAVPLPSNLCTGIFNGNSPDQIKNNLSFQIEKAFRRRAIAADFMLCISESMLWEHQSI